MQTDPKSAQILYSVPYKWFPARLLYNDLVVVVILFKVIFLVNSHFIFMQSSGSYQAVVRQSPNLKFVKFVILCAAYRAKRLFSLVILKIERGLENVASLTVYVEI